MNHASLFSGIGGFDLAADRMGWTNVFNCELDEWCQKVLRKNFPNATQYSDIRTTDFSVWRGRIDILTGGFPCQPFSHAGKRKGNEDDRALWPQMLRVIREVAPRWVVGENVGGLLTQSDGLVFESCLSDLEAEDYETQTFVLPACGVNAPHRRDRVWIVAYRSDTGIESVRPQRQDAVHGPVITTDANNRQRESANAELRAGRNAVGVSCNAVTTNANISQKRNVRREPEEVAPKNANNSHISAVRTTTDPGSSGCKNGLHGTGTLEQRQANQSGNRYPRTDWSDWPTQPPLCLGNDGFPARLVRLESRWRNNTIKAAGNAVVPQVIYQLFQAIQHIEDTL